MKKELTNSEIAELMAMEGETASPTLQRAFRRAAHRAFLWPEEASEMVRQGCSLTELPGIGPYLEKRIRRWMDAPPHLPPRPQIRSGFLTRPEARAALAKNTAWFAAIKGDLQMHTTWSDGSGSIEEMAVAAMDRNYEYISITDHSKGLKIAGGIDEMQLRQQGKEIEAINDSLHSAGKSLRILRSIELNLNPQGQGDMEEDSLAELDLVVGCFHSALRKSEDQTERYLAALGNPMIQILGHPRGRIYNYRSGLKADWPRVFERAAELDKAVEIDGYPDRQDLSPDLLQLARKAGCRISLSTDSHGPSQLSFMEFSGASALISEIPRDRILNLMTADRLVSWAQNVREADKAA